MSEPMMNIYFRFLIMLGTAWTSGGLAFAEAEISESGRLQKIACGKDWIPVESDVLVSLKGWQKTLSLSGANSKPARKDAVSTWEAVLEEKDGPSFKIVQTAQLTPEGVIFDIQVTPLKDCDVEGVYF